MSFEYHPVGVYRRKYAVLAKFYNNGEARLFADVVDRDHVDAPIDAYLIMINPGSCKIQENESSLIKNSNYYKELDVVEAVSDPAQKCVMAFMDICNLKKIRILNLMDYKSGNYVKALSSISQQNIEMSLSSQKREEQRKEIMSEKAVVIAAWGTDKRLSAFKEQAFHCLRGDIIIGIRQEPQKEYFDFKYIKPPTKDAQIKQIWELTRCFLQYKSETCVQNNVHADGV